MRLPHSRIPLALGLCGAAVIATTIGGLARQVPAGQAAAPQAAGRGGGRGGAAPMLFSVVDTNKDGSVTRDEFKSSFDTLFTKSDVGGTGSVTQDQLLAALNAAAPQAAPAGGGRGTAAQNQTPNPADVQAMLAALPDKAPVAPRQPRKVLVLGKAAGFVHSSIPLAARTVEELGKKTGEGFYVWENGKPSRRVVVNDHI